MAFLNADQKKQLGPFLGLVQVALAAVGAYAVYGWVGGDKMPIPILDTVTPFALGGIAFYVLWREVRR